nr:cache domain-containing protein [Thiomicrorhabdus cannonii]
MVLSTFWAIQKLTLEKHKEVRQTYQNYVQKTLNGQHQIVLTNVIALSNNPGLQKALAERNRASAQQLLDDVLKQYKKFSGFKNVKIHLHTADFKSFLRSWKPEQYGDNLSPFRHSLHHLALTQTPFASVELGREGILLRGFALMKYEGRIVGSIEFIQSFEEVIQELNQQYNLQALILSSHDKTIDYFHTLTLVGTNRVLLNSRPHNNQPLIQALANYDFDQLEKDQQIIRPPYYFTSVPLYDFKNDKVGCFLVADNLTHVNSLIDSTRSALYWQIASLALVDLLIIGLLIILLRQRVIRPLSQLRAQLASINPFFGDADKLREILPLRTNHKDEFGALTHCLNLFFQRTCETFSELTLARKLHQETLQNVMQPSARLTTDGQGKIHSVSADFLKLIHATDDTLSGQTFNHCLHPQIPRVLVRKMQRAISQGEVWQGILKLAAADGRTLYTRTTVVPDCLPEQHSLFLFENVTDLVTHHEPLLNSFRTHPASLLGDHDKLEYDYRHTQQAYLAKLSVDVQAETDAQQHTPPELIQQMTHYLLDSFEDTDYTLYQLNQQEFAVLANALLTPQKTFIEQMEHFLMAHNHTAIQTENPQDKPIATLKLSIGVSTQHYGLLEQAHKALQQAQQTTLPHVVVMPPLTDLQRLYR